jgi:ABC-type phosphate transport system substrate-binding protein
VRKLTKLSTSLAAVCTTVGALSLAVGGALPAHASTTVKADYAPIGGATFGDVVGDGSDTLQFIVDFGADGDVSGDSGYNDAGNLYKLVSMDATADSNARFSWANGSTLANPLALDPTAVYRGGTFPVQRINGSGAGINALLADTSPSDPYINFARMSSNPTAAEGATAQANGWQGLQDFVLGHEDLRAAADLTTNAPAGLTTTQLAAIYECTDTTWASLGSTGANAADHIIPIIPQSGSGTRNTFLADIGITAAQLGSCVSIGEENDPTAITSLTGTTNPNGGTCTPACSADAIEPFSGARLNLYSGLSGNTAFGSNPGSGYFHDPTANYPGGATLVPGIKQLSGAPLGGGSSYDDNRALNIVFRWTDQISSTSWQPGGTLNWAETLFCNPGGTTTPFFQTAAGKTLIAEAGGDPSSQSCLSTPLT